MESCTYKKHIKMDGHGPHWIRCGFATKPQIADNGIKAIAKRGKTWKVRITGLQFAGTLGCNIKDLPFTIGNYHSLFLVQHQIHTPFMILHDSSSFLSFVLRDKRWRSKLVEDENPRRSLSHWTSEPTSSRRLCSDRTWTLDARGWGGRAFLCSPKRICLKIRDIWKKI